jgi:diacylglycerol O-acyltransferase
MPQQHLDRLSPLDASFLHQESPESHMHVGGPAVFAGPAPTFDAFIEQIRGRLHLVPRYRQKLASTALDRGRPVWVDDSTFDIARHVRHAVLPAPGGWEELCALTARIYSERLDRARPLWELWFVDGMADGHFALVSKSHHALIDGSSGVDLATVLLDVEPNPPAVAPPTAPWRPQPEPGATTLVGAALRDARRGCGTLLAAARRVAAHPARAFANVRRALEALAEIARALLDAAPATPLNVKIGPDRRFLGVPCELDEFKAIKRAFGGTINDVVLTVVTGALRSFLISRDVPTDGLELRGLVPVSTRQENEHHQLGNRMIAVRAPLPVCVADPVERLGVIRHAMDRLKGSKQAYGADVIVKLERFLPPPLLPLMSRLNFSTRLFNVLVTNLPGPPIPLYALGREMQMPYAIAFLPKDHALSINVMSYAGQMNFGLLADRNAIPELEMIGDSVRSELDALLARAVAARERPVIGSLALG